MKKCYLFMLIVVISLIVPTQKNYAQEIPQDEIMELSEKNTDKIEEFIRNQMNRGDIPGLSIAIVEGNSTVYQKGFGYLNIEAKEPVTPETLFEIGSNSKAMTAMGILKLQEEGKLNLSDDISKYIPWLKFNYQGKAASISIEQFLHHTSGVPFRTIDNIPVSDNINALEETVKILIDSELDSQPDEEFQYATINYDVLGLVIEKITKEPYEEYIKENVLKPMDLNNTYLFQADTDSLNLAQGYMIGFLKAREYPAPKYRGNTPAGYIISNAVDMAKWLKIQLGTYENSKFSTDIIKASQEANRRIRPLEDGSSYAAGWFEYQVDGGEYFHGGNNPNYSSYIIFRPEEQIGIAVLSNINTAYTEVIANGIKAILLEEEYTTKIKDFNKSADIFSIIFIGFAILIIIGTGFFLIKSLIQIVKKERYIAKINIKSVINLVISLIFMLGLSYSIYKIPYIFYNGVSWSFVYIWLPVTIKIAVYIAYLCIWFVYIYVILTSVFKKDDDKRFLLLSVLSVLSGFGNALIIFTINIGMNSSNTMKLQLLIYFILGLVLYVYGQKIIRVKLVEITNEIVYTKRISIIKYLLGASYETFEEIENGRIAATLNNDTETVSRYAIILMNGVTSVITLVFCFIYLGFINKYALLLSLSIIILIASIYYFAGIYANKVGEQSRDLQNTFFKFIDDLILGFKELIMNNKRKDEFHIDMEDSCIKYREKKGQAAIAFANVYVIGELLFTLAIGSVVFVLSFILKDLSTISIISYVFVLLYMIGPVHGILDVIPDTIEVRISLKRINELVNQLVLLKEATDSDISYKKEEAISLKLHDVEYEYNDKDERRFKVGPISYEFKAGEIIFITGGNGSGKSTLARLLSGLYTHGKGFITINDKEVSREILNQQYSTIFGDFHLFDKLYGIDYKEKENEIKKYLKLLRLNEIVEIVEGKFSTTKLSTGQKKRLALLVTYLEDRPIYLFDEWAADQDPEFRKFFYENLLPDLKRRGKCVIAITHDDYFFGSADKILKMEMGKCI